MAHRVSPRSWSKQALPCVLLASLAAGAASPAARGQSATPASVLQQHYERAQSLQSSGDLVEAARQYRLFIADALDEMALDHAHRNEYQAAAPLFDEALALAPNSPALKVEYARAALTAGDYSRARTLAEGVVRDYPANAKACAKAHVILGRVLLKTSGSAAARREFEAAVALEPDFENGYALAIACLDLGDGKCAADVFSEMISGLGDSALLHLEFGRAYLNSDFQQDALPELKQAIALDAHLPGAHYSLAVAYLTAGGDNGAALAEHELEAELALSPKDAATHAELGNIALGEHKYADAEGELQTAAALDPANASTFLYLGRLYQETGRSSQAIAALRDSIRLTTDPAFNRYQVQKAHYLLGHLLMESGQAEAGKQEIQAASALLKQSLSRDRSQLSGYLQEADASKQPGAPEPQSAAEPAAAPAQFEKQLAPAVADAYNNLGAIAAETHDLPTALTSFTRAFEWNPGLEGLDANWGRAALLNGSYAEAVPPLTRFLKIHPEDTSIRSALAISLFMTHSYAGVLATLSPLGDQADSTPQLAYIHAAALVKTGSYEAGIRRLQALEAADAKIAGVHLALGEAYAAEKDLPRATSELNTAIALDHQNADAYLALGTLQQQRGEYQQAVSSLEAAAKLDPGNLDVHRQLALAYRRDTRPKDADREQAIYEGLSARLSKEVRDH